MIQQGRLAVVDVSHDSDHGRPRLQIFRLVLNFGNKALHGELIQFQFVPEFVSDKTRRIKIDGLVDMGHDPLRHEFFDQSVGLDAHGLCKFTHRHAFLDLDPSLYGLGEGNFGLF